MAKRLHTLNRRRKNSKERHYCQFEYRPVALYEDDPHFSPYKKQCGYEGMECFYPGSYDKPDVYLCGKHREIEGFCVGCGSFSAGIESFDFGKYHGFCDNCASEVQAEDFDFYEYADYAYSGDYPADEDNY